MYDIIIDAIHTILRNGLTWGSLLGVLFLFLKTRKLKRKLQRLLPMLFDDETAAYIENQKRIEQKVDALLQEGGIVYCAKESGTKAYPTSGKTSFTLPWVEKYSAHIVKRFTNFNTKRGMRRMNKFKSRKFWLTVVMALLVIANDGLQLNLPSEAIMTVAGVVISYIVGESYIDGKKVNPVEEHSFDSERIDN
jgi:uncharacterized membrane protein